MAQQQQQGRKAEWSVSDERKAFVKFLKEDVMVPLSHAQNDPNAHLAVRRVLKTIQAAVAEAEGKGG